MTTNLRYFQLLQQIEKNPLRPAVAGAFDVASDFKLDMERIGADRRLSAEGRREAMQDLVRKAVRDIRDIQKPLNEHRAKTAELRAKVQRPPYDKSDIVGAMARREMRDASRAMTFGQRSAKLAGPTRSVAFVDALLEFADDPWMSGVDIFNPSELEIFEAAKTERLRDFHGPLLDTIAEREAVEIEAAMVPAVARVDVQNDSGLQSREFEEVAKPIESKVGAPWLKRFTEEGREIIRVIDLQTNRAHTASEREILDGKFYKDLAEYQADRAA
jgi:hypothetical protein